MTKWDWQTTCEWHPIVACNKTTSSVANSPSYIYVCWLTKTSNFIGNTEAVLKRKHPWTHSHENPSINFLLTVSSSWTFPYTCYLFPSHPLEAGLTANHLPGPSVCLRFQGQVFSSPNTGHDLHVISAKLFPFYNTSAFGIFPCIYKPRTRIWFWANVEEIEYDWLPRTSFCCSRYEAQIEKNNSM